MPSPDVEATRLPNTAHTARPWRIHGLAFEFQLEDVWALPTPGGKDDFPRFVRRTASYDPLQSSSRVVRKLFAIRAALGRVSRLDEPGNGLPTLCDRLPQDLRDLPGPDFDPLRFTSLYQLDNEWAAELANKLVHVVLHFSWVQDETGGYRGQMAVLVKRNGLSGKAYMAAIAPFRHRLVYPPLLRDLGRAWVS